MNPLDSIKTLVNKFILTYGVLGIIIKYFWKACQTLGIILRPFSGLAHSKLEFVKIEGDTMCVKRNCLMPLSIWGMGWGQSMLNLPEDCCIPAAARDKDLE